MPDEIALLFALEAPKADDVPTIKDLIAGLIAERAWAVGSIEFVDEVDFDSAARADDVPIWTLGGVLPLRRPHRATESSERAQLDDVEFLIDRPCAFTRAGRTLLSEYDGEEIGEVGDGEAHRGIVVGLLGEWRDGLQGAGVAACASVRDVPRRRSSLLPTLVATAAPISSQAKNAPSSHTPTLNGDSAGSANEREGSCRSTYRSSVTRRRRGPG